MLHAFLEFELDEDRFELRRAGSPVRVEPRVFEVLAYLVRNRGRVVAKEELLDHVWKKTFVSESALTRCIMESRRAIGDQGRPEPLIKTVHGRGYRFELAEETSAPVVPEVPAIPVAVAQPKAMPWHWVAIVALVFIAGAALWLTRTRPAEATPLMRIALLPVSASVEDRELQLVGMSIADLLEQRLTKIPRLRVRGADYSGPLSNDAPTLAEFARRAGVDRVVSGNVTPVEGRQTAWLALTLHEVRPNGVVRDTPLGRYEMPLLRGSSDIRHYAALRDRIVERVVDTLTPAFETGVDGDALTPHDFDAYRFYLLARERLASESCDGEAAVELLRRSLEIDPQFAPAWDAYGWAHDRLASRCGGGAQHYKSALEGAENALRLAPGIGSAIALRARVMMTGGKPEEALRVLREATRRQPADPDLQFAYLSVLAQAGSTDQARIALDRLQRLDPSYLAQRGFAPTAYLYASDSRRFLQALPAIDAPVFRYHRGWVELMEKRPAIAQRVLEPAFRLNPSDDYARLSQALLAIIEQRPDEAREIVRQFAKQRELVGAIDGEMTYRTAQLFALAGDRDAALRQLSRSVEQGFFCVPYLESDPAMASLRGEQEFARVIERARERQARLSQGVASLLYNTGGPPR